LCCFDFLLLSFSKERSMVFFQKYPFSFPKSEVSFLLPPFLFPKEKEVDTFLFFKRKVWIFA